MTEVASRETIAERRAKGEAIATIRASLQQFPKSTVPKLSLLTGIESAEVRKILERLVDKGEVMRSPREYSAGGKYRRAPVLVSGRALAADYVRYWLNPDYKWDWRRCLSCGDKFWSWGPKNRMCKRHAREVA